MATKITRDVLEGYLNCKYKGHLKLVGQQGTKSDYENLLTERRADVRLAAFDKILAQNPTEEVVRNVTLTTSVLKRAPLFILDGTLEDDLFSLDFDGLKKVDGPSKLGGFHYVPMLFFEGTKIGKPQRLLLEIQGLLLSRIQNRTPAVGIVWLGEECRASNMRLGSDQRAIERLLRELREMAASESTPSLILNDHCSVCEFRQQCHAQAVKEDNLSLMRGMNEKTMTHQNSKGIFTVTQLSYTFRTRRKSKRIKHPSTPHHFPLQALAIRENKVFVHGSPAFSPCPTRVYIDFEGDPEQRAYYLIGLIAVENGLQTRHSYWADSECDQVQIFRQLMDYLERYADYSLLHFGSYEVNALRRMKAHMPASYHQPIENAVQRSINVLSFIHPHIYFPAYSNSLKDLGHYLGCTWSAPSSSGIQSLVWRRQWLRSRDDGLKSELTRYNIEDCMALRKVAEFVERIAAGRPGSEGPGEPLPIVFTNTLPTKADHRHVFKKAVFALDDFALVNRCAYFDYQRDKVFARSCDGVRRANRSKKHRRSPSHRISKCVELHLGRCPSCTSRWIKPLRALHRLTVDLRFTSSGVRRWVVRYDSWRYRCSKCEGTFTPGAFPSNKAKYGRGLISWCIYHHFARGQNMRQVAEALPDLFGLHSSRVPVDRFKIAVAEFYQAYYEALRDEILAGHLLHIDETEVALRGKKGYVWVIASMSAAYYFYRDSREGHFLQEMLKAFRGVLVSDFYTAYDSVDCRHQRCLIHLMRDLNEDLLRHPFNEEFRELTKEFGALLRVIILTVDRYGLRKRHLQKHRSAVSRFFDDVVSREFCSEVAQKYQKRLQKYRGMLFTFLEHDGVPWNNNNAEHAIKSFVKHRRFADGTFTEVSIREYLTILSVYKTCEYRGVNFLRFLLNGEERTKFGSGKRKVHSVRPNASLHEPAFGSQGLSGDVGMPYEPMPP